MPKTKRSPESFTGLLRSNDVDNLHENKGSTIVLVIKSYKKDEQ